MGWPLQAVLAASAAALVIIYILVLTSIIVFSNAKVASEIASKLPAYAFSKIGVVALIFSVVVFVMARDRLNAPVEEYEYEYEEAEKS